MGRTNMSIIHAYVSDEETKNIVEKVMKKERFVLENVRDKDTWVWGGCDRDVVPCICCIYEENELILQLFLHDFEIDIEFDLKYNLFFREGKKRLKAIAENIESIVNSHNNWNYLKTVKDVPWYILVGFYLRGIRRGVIRRLIRFLWKFA